MTMRINLLCGGAAVSFHHLVLAAVHVVFVGSGGCVFPADGDAWTMPPQQGELVLHHDGPCQI